ncbi:MAG: GNAT family N-acetyltransferase [Desulfobacteraceae bacterium]|jgi:ribosomal protein S18 acetylase RimI-like enzyme
MKIRQACEQDVEQLAVLHAQVQTVHIDLYPNLFRCISNEVLCEMLRRSLNDELTIILVAEEGEHVIGYLVLKKQIRPELVLINERRCGYIDQICVSAQHRRKGIFNRLLNEAKKIVIEWDFDRIELFVWSDNQVAKDTFCKCGFVTYIERMKFDLKASK